MHHGPPTRRSAGVLLPGALPLLILLAPLMILTNPVTAAELPLTPVFASDEDLLRVVTRQDGVVGVLREGTVESVQPGGATLDRVTAAQGERLYLADDGVRIGVLHHRPGAADFAPTESFELGDLSGARIWRVGSTEDVTYAISARGAVVGISLNVNVPERNLLHFYGREGATVIEISAPYLLDWRFDRQGSVFFALGSNGLRAFDSDGDELWQLPGVRLFAASEDGAIVAVVGEGPNRWLRLVHAGEVVASVDLGDLLVRRIAIAPDGSRAVVAGGNTLRVFQGAALDLLWETGTGAADLVFTSVDLAADEGWLLAGLARDLGAGVPVRERHPDGEIRAYDAAGILRHSAHLDFPAWNIWTPSAELDRDGQSATITTRRAVYRTALP